MTVAERLRPGERGEARARPQSWGPPGTGGLARLPVPGAQPRRARSTLLTGTALIASQMLENGGRDSLDGRLRAMLRRDFPQLAWQHNSDSRRAHSGWPDWVIGARPGGVLVRELKREHLNPTRAQQEWLDILEAAGLDVGVWRPSDLLSGRIARELAAIALPCADTPACRGERPAAPGRAIVVNHRVPAVARRPSGPAPDMQMARRSGPAAENFIRDPGKPSRASEIRTSTQRNKLR